MATFYWLSPRICLVFALLSTTSTFFQPNWLPCFLLIYPECTGKTLANKQNYGRFNKNYLDNNECSRGLAVTKYKCNCYKFQVFCNKVLKEDLKVLP